MAKGYIVVGPAFEYNDSGYNVVGDNCLLQDKVFTSKDEANDLYKKIWLKAFAEANENRYESYQPWYSRDLPDLNRELFSIGSKLYIQDTTTPVTQSLSDDEFNILMHYWSGPRVARIKEIQIG